MNDPQDHLGQQIGEYRLLRLLGVGSFGKVYLAQSMHEPTPVAFKLLQKQLSREEDLKGFLNEARSIRLRHPHIVPLIDFGLSRTNLPYLVMEYAEGGTLSDRIPHDTQLPLAVVSSYISQVASALQYAHDRRVIHRDVKQGNMLLRSDGTVLLSDFGIARMLEQNSTMSTSAYAGTPAYMAPEQAQGRPLPASDQYALAVVAYEWLAGRRPFQGAPMEILAQHHFQAPPPLCPLRADLPQEAEQVILRALAKQPEERFATVEQFAQALRAALLPHSMGESPARMFSAPPGPGVASSPFTPMFPTPSSPGIMPSPPLPPHLPEQALPASISHNPTSPVFQAGRQTMQPSGPFYPQLSATPMPIREQKRARPRPLVLLLIGLAFLIVVSTSGYFALSASLKASTTTPAQQAGNNTTDHLQALQTTATAQAQATKGPATATAQATATTADQKQQSIAAYNQGVASNGAMFGFDTQHTNNNPYEQTISTTNVTKLVQAWTAPISGSSSPVVVNGVIYIGSDNGQLFALDAQSGHQKWVASPPSGASTSFPGEDFSPAVVNGVVYVSWGKLFAFNAQSGQLQWSFAPGGKADNAMSSPTVADGFVYIISTSLTYPNKSHFPAYKLYALDARSGQQRWSSPAVLAAPQNGYIAPPSVSNGIVYVGSQVTSDKFYAFNEQDGQQQWAFSTGAGSTESVSYAAVANGTIYLGTGSGKLLALDALSGQQKWLATVGTGIHSAPAIANGIVYVSGGDNKLYAFDAQSGQQKWSVIVGSLFNTAPFVANGIVYINTMDSKLVALDALSGQQRWSFTTGSSSASSSPDVANGMVYVSSGSGKFYAFTLSTT